MNNCVLNVLIFVLLDIDESIWITDSFITRYSYQCTFKGTQTPSLHDAGALCLTKNLRDVETKQRFYLSNETTLPSRRLRV